MQYYLKVLIFNSKPLTGSVIPSFIKEIKWKMSVNTGLICV